MFSVCKYFGLPFYIKVWTCLLLQIFYHWFWLKSSFNFSWNSFLTFLNSIFFTIKNNSSSKFFLSLTGGGHLSDLKPYLFLLLSSSFPWNAQTFYLIRLLTFSTFDINDNIYIYILTFWWNWNVFLWIIDDKLFNVMKISLKVLNCIGACYNIKFVFNFEGVLNWLSVYDNITSWKLKAHVVYNY